MYDEHMYHSFCLSYKKKFLSKMIFGHFIGKTAIFGALEVRV